jgi:hypothetical protein
VTVGQDIDYLFIRVAELERKVRKLALAGHMMVEIEQDKTQRELREIKVTRGQPKRPMKPKR